MKVPITGRIDGKRCYISGPMKGIEGYNRQAFLSMEARLRGLGAKEVWNPADLIEWHESGVDRPFLIEEDMRHLADSDIIVMLDGWEESEGARFEHEAAKLMGKFIIFEKAIRAAK